MHSAVKLACVGAMTVVTGCSTLSALNPFDKKAPRNPPAALVDLAPTMTVRTAWTTSIGSAGTSIFSPAVVADSVYVAAKDGALGRIESASGRAVWRINAGVPLTAGVGADASTVAVVGPQGAVMAFDTDGKLRWKAQASSEVLSAPAVGQGLVVVRSVDNRIAAYDAQTGDRRWFLQRTSPALTLRAAPGIVITEQGVYVGLPGGRLVALALNNGGPRWGATVADPRGASELERIADISGDPVVLGQSICAASYQGRVGCFDTATGAPRWTKALSSDVGIGFDERFIFAADENGAVNGFTREAGASVWRNDKLGYRRLSAPISIGRAVAVGDAQGYIHFMSREDGALLARVATDGSAVTGNPKVAGANVIFQTKSGTVTALAVE
ncbi:MAG: outer membrane protein assembly factor BamB [Herminiimonas sp.]|nr:outer membrane protein assembly factor BamB [Herminiimonas sp.]